MDKLVYLAGPITGCTTDAAMGWRAAAHKELASVGIRDLCPIDVTTAGSELKDVAVLRDMIDVKRCDVVLMNLLGAKQVTIGTMIELGWASALGKPIVLVMEPNSNIHEHGFVRYLTTIHTTSLSDGLETIKTLLQGQN